MNARVLLAPPLLATCRDLARHLAAQRSGSAAVSRTEIDWRIDECNRALRVSPAMPRTPRRGRLARAVAS